MKFSFEAIHLWESLPEIERLKFKAVQSAGLRSTVIDWKPR